jgi:hypothetical protein
MYELSNYVHIHKKLLKIFTIITALFLNFNEDYWKDKFIFLSHSYNPNTLVYEVLNGIKILNIGGDFSYPKT